MGEWISSEKRLSARGSSASGREVRNPYNQELLGMVPEATKQQVDDAIESAQRAFKLTKFLPAHKRSLILENTSATIRKRKEELARTITLESGKPIKLARGEVDRATETFKFAAEEAKRLYGETIPMDASTKGENRVGFTFREPLGVIGAITPFNFPLNLVAHKVAPAIAAGNTVVLKPSTYTPITSIKLGEIMLSAGLPKRALNIVIGTGSIIGNAIVSNPKISKITFTGSQAVGIEIQSKVGLKRTTLELGSNSPVIIDKDVGATLAVAQIREQGQALPLQKIVERCVFGSFAYAGQVCISVQRIYVHQDIKNTFIEQFIRATKKLKLGNPLDETTDIGPMITKQEASRAKKWIDEAVSQGAKVLIGGNHKGPMFEPTVLIDVGPEMKVVSQEIFAPVVSIIEFDNWERVIDDVNLSNYGLHAGVYTNDVKKAFYAAKTLEVGGVIVNDIPTYRVDHIPYGGVKGSGIGREGVKYAIEELTQPKFVCFNLSA